MSIQDISITNNQAKHLLKALPNEDILIKDETGELVINVAAYMEYKKNEKKTPVETIVGEDLLDKSAEFWVFIS